MAERAANRTPLHQFDNTCPADALNINNYMLDVSVFTPETREREVKLCVTEAWGCCSRYWPTCSSSRSCWPSWMRNRNRFCSLRWEKNRSGDGERERRRKLCVVKSSKVWKHRAEDLSQIWTTKPAIGVHFQNWDLCIIWKLNKSYFHWCPHNICLRYNY